MFLPRAWCEQVVSKTEEALLNMQRTRSDASYVIAKDKSGREDFLVVIVRGEAAIEEITEAIDGVTFGWPEPDL